MKKLLLNVFMIVFIINANGQNNNPKNDVKKTTVNQNSLNISVVKDNNLNRLLNEFEILKEITVGDLFIRMIILNNGAGSAGGPSGEVTHNLYIAVSEPGEIFIGNLFLIKNLYDVQFENANTTDLKNPIITISYGAYDKRKIVKLKISINKIIASS